jgi:hypothetical protein
MEPSATPQPPTQPTAPQPPAAAAPAAAPIAPQPAPVNDDKLLEYVLPINRSGFAIAAGYLAFFNLLIITAPVTGTLSILFGVLGLRNIKQHPGRLGKGRAWFGIISGGIALFILILFAITN